MSYKPYPAYKDSGVEWLGEIPEAWDTLRIGFFYSRVKETDRGDLPLLSVYREYGVIPKNSRDDNFNNASEDLSTYQVVQENDLVINKMKAWQGSLGISHYEGIVSPAYFVLRPRQECTYSFNKQFLHYLLRSQIYFAEYEKRSKGIRINQWDLPYEEFKTIAVLLPPLLTQKAIAAFLDARTARIDGLVRDYEELVALLKEKRQALVSHAVTRGLSELVSPDDPDFGEWTRPVAFKDSGVDWLGEIPEGWNLSPLFVILPEHYVQNIGMQSSDVLSLSYGKIIQKDVSDNFGLLPESFETYQLVYPDDIILRLTDLQNDQQSLRTAISSFYGIITSAYIKLRCFQNPSYFHWLLYSADIQKVFYGLGGGVRQSMKYVDLKRFLLVVPPLTTQKAIAAFLDRETTKLDALVAEVEGAIELLKERRSALITAAITGKINVEGIDVTQP
jgi:type I restriction enzyme S subunit